MPRGRPAKYPWDTWTNGGRHVIRQSDEWELGSTEFFPMYVKTTSFRAECHAAARRKGGRADTKIMGNTVHFRFLED